MIAYLKGTIQAANDKFVVVNTGAIGYKVFVARNLRLGLQIGAPVEFFTHTYLREDAQELYGFKTFAELEIFELLISVSGIGPKAGLGILDSGGPEEVRAAIAHGEKHFFTRISGIGTKTADRLILELQSKVGPVSGKAQSPRIKTSEEAVGALRNLGYTDSEAREKLRDVKSSLTIEEQVKAALKN